MDFSKVILERYLLSEVKTDLTESLHEISFSVAFAAIMENQIEKFVPEKIDTIQKFANIQKGLKSIEFKDENIKELKTRGFGGDHNKEVKIMKDAISCAHAVRDYLVKANADTGGFKYKSVQRVFERRDDDSSTGHKGKKPIADAVISTKTQDIAVSLKFGAGQAGSLQLSKVADLLFDKDVSSGDIMKQMVSEDFKGPVDNTLRAFIKCVKTNHGKTLAMVKKYKVGTKLHFDGGLPSVPDNVKYLDYMTPKMSKVRWHFSKGYEDLGNMITGLKRFADSVKKTNAAQYKTIITYVDKVQKDINTYLDMKRQKLGGSIWKYLDYQGGKGISQEKFKKLLTYLLRSEDTDAYIYVAKGGSKIAMVPSAEMVKKMNYKYNVVYNPSTTDFSVTLIVSHNKTWLFKFVFFWRFTTGQYGGALSHATQSMSFNTEYDWSD